ncbi:DUF3025 domain-containing protein [Parachitinimonas caeni]|uniref:DUF3025 domain-containing protein n=1 Tax=Parachitinimonas caeni TaxID=3031301 RepID=A0ABT7DTX9_9NEIS|nr:DUF3025 domain-containing protein [Parachitinimonas caeni]MDK2123526.1 DUF3025 domain-containing protein [Parachitinimonas caeni]
MSPPAAPDVRQPDWPTDWLVQHPAYACIRPVLQQLGWQHFPTTAQWQTLPDALRPRLASGLPVQFIDRQPLEPGYEYTIATLGEVPTRPANWHDTFNALIWLAYPRSKAALNTLHSEHLPAAPHNQSKRGPQRDAATLFDESGLILACADHALAQALQHKNWHQLFQTARTAWGQTINGYVFGHALLEKLLTPFIGITAKVMIVPVQADFFAQSLATQLVQLDAQIASHLARNSLQAPRDLPPLPVLGIPGWWPQQDTAFYSNTRHFCPPRGI